MYGFANSEYIECMSDCIAMTVSKYTGLGYNAAGEAGAAEEHK